VKVLAVNITGSFSSERSLYMYKVFQEE